MATEPRPDFADWCEAWMSGYNAHRDRGDIESPEDDDGEGKPIEQARNEKFRVPGPKTWAEMKPFDQRVQRLLDAGNRLALNVIDDIPGQEALNHWRAVAEGKGDG